MSEMDQMCRTCLSSVKELLSIYTLISSGDREDQNGTRIVDCFTECFKIEMTEDDKLPQKICLSCLDNILEVRKFYHRCINSENYLKQQIDFNQTIKIEPITGFVSKIEVESASNAAVLDENIEYEVLEVSNEIVTTSEIVKDVSQFRCVECDENFKYEKNFKLHMKLEHVSLNEPDVKQFIDNNVCDETGPQNEFEDVKTLKKANIIDKPYKCDKCDCSFRYIRSLLRHKNQEKTTENLAATTTTTIKTAQNKNVSAHICQICNEEFKLPRSLRRHIISAHKKISEIKKNESQICPSCGIKTQTNKSMLKHMKIHNRAQNPAEYKCQFCARVFNSRNSLRLHERTHTGEKPYKCSVCAKAFTQHSTWSLHLTLHTGGAKKFACCVCDKKFNHRGFLNYHMLEHTEERPFACDICPKTYKQSTHLKTHRLTHLSEKPFSCTICSKLFTQKTSLTNHMYLHTAKPFKCPVPECSMRFIVPHRFRKHLIKLHNIHDDPKKYKVTETTQTG